MQIIEEFKKLCAFYRKKYKKQIAFRSLKMARNKNGEKEPVFYIGGPGLMVALAITFLTIASVYLLYLPFMWYVWVPYIIFMVLLFKTAMRVDRVRQIRHMVYYLLESGLQMLERAETSEDASEKDECMTKALDWLEKADKWVEEPALKAQLDLLKNNSQ